MGLPQELGSYLRNQLNQSCHALCLALDADLRLTGHGGDPDYYGIAPLVSGMALEEILPWLTDTLDGKFDRPEVLPLVETQNGRSAAVHLVPLPQGWGVLLLDASAEGDRQRDRQQASNELKLLQRRHARLLEELRQAHGELQRRNRDLDRANQSKSRFIANMSHEFRTPITAVLGYTDLLRDSTGADPEAERYLDAIERGTRHLLALVDNLLEQAGIENSKLEITPVPTDVSQLFTEVLDLFQSLVRSKSLYLRFESGGFPPLVLLDELRLRQILINLVGNAAKFTQRGGIVLRACWQQGELEISVTDSGPGIPPEARARIFRAFEQANQGQRLQGAGLGLSISNKLVQRMGGTLTLDPEVQTGSRFWVRLPAPLAAGEPAPRVQSQPEQAETSILIAEDDPDIRALMELTLARPPYQVRFVENGKQALEAIQENPPDLVLLDMNMPVMDGPTAARELRHQGYNMPIIALTAAASGAPRDEAHAAGCDHYLTKPLNIDRLREIVSELLE
jgi:signal transduction histidine kinase/CheY-like chemotaxis protein